MPGRGRMRILFVCSGNTCRSPMAEAIAKARLGAAISVVSAGAPNDSMSWGSPASPRTIEVMSRRRIDLSGHQSRPLEEALNDGVPDLVLAMELKHAERVRSLRPEFADRTFVLKRFVRTAEAIGLRPPSEPLAIYLGRVLKAEEGEAIPADDEIADPIFENTLEAYENCAAQFEYLVERLFALLVPDLDR